MLLKMDPDILKTAEFMQRNIPADKLLFVASALDMLSPALWGHNHPDFDPSADSTILTLEEGAPMEIIPDRKN